MFLNNYTLLSILCDTKLVVYNNNKKSISISVYV